MSRQAIQQLFRIEIAEALRSRWMTFTGGIYALVFIMFIWLGLRESSVLGFTGLSRVVLNVSSAVVLIIPLVALVATSQTIVRARHGGFFELWLSQPVRRLDWFAGVALSRFLVVVGPLLVLVVLTLIVGSVAGERDAALLPMALRSLVVTASLAWAFMGIGFWISAWARTPERATVLALVAWLAGSALHDFALIGTLLRFHVSPVALFTLAAANPVETARIAILSGVDPDLSVLGPVGFWIASSLGRSATLALGVGWPLLLGTFFFWRAKRRLDGGDLVG